MKRLALALGIVLATGVSFMGMDGRRFDQKLSKDQQIVHVLNRLTFGPRPGDVDQVRRIGIEKWIDQQLHPDRIPENPRLEVKLMLLDTLKLATWEIMETYQPRRPTQAKRVGTSSNVLTPQQRQKLQRGTSEEKQEIFDSLDDEARSQLAATLPLESLADLPELRREAMIARQPAQFVNSELIASKLYRSIYSNRQLEEVLVDFWVNHFNVYNGKGPGRMLLTGYERDAIRPFVLGKFKDMLLATARHPAMLYYLDNWQSQAPREDLPASGTARRPGLNENYGRELMELHTLGVDGGYTQEDVIAVARAFTGWTIYEPNRVAEFHFNPAMHDRKEKVVLGHTIAAGGGETDALQVLDILARHPSTARFISKKLAQRFVADDPPKALVDRMAATFTKTDGDLRKVLETLFTSREFLSAAAFESKLKSPLEMVVSAVRAVDANVNDTFSLAQRIAELGQPLYGKAEPTGYSNTGEGWANTAGLLARINFSSALMEDRVPGVRVSASRYVSKTPNKIALELLSSPPSEHVEAAITTGLQGKTPTPAVIASLVIASPDFQRR
jgi:uncharacterized protein (DUF1800 family)